MKQKHFMDNDTFGLYTARVYYDWQQARDEGRDVKHLKEVTQEIQKRFYDEDRDVTLGDYDLACSLEKTMNEAPFLKDAKYVEPSTYQEILQERPEVKREVSSIVDGELKRKTRGGWLGKVTGCLLGKPLEFWKVEPLTEMLKEIGNYPVTRYVSTEDFTPEMIKKYDILTGTPLNNQPWIDELEGYAPIDDDTNYTVLNLKLMEVFGYDFEPGDVLYAWLNWLPAGVVCTAERVAYRNAVMGFSAPYTATFQNPYREWVGAQIRAEVFGWVNPGNPEAAAEAAFRNASVSHVRNGIYGEMFTAAMVAKAMTSTDLREVIEAGLGEIPQNSRLASAIKSVIEDYDNGMSFDDAVKKLHELHDESNIFEWCHIVPNGKIVVLSLLYADGDYTKAIGNAMQCAFDTDSNGAVVGAVMGTLFGPEVIEEKWTEPIGGLMGSTVVDEPMNKIEEMVERTIKVTKREINPDTSLKRRYDYNESFDVE